jgi:xylulokinase
MKPTRAFIGIDVGTSVLKVGIVSTHGELISLARKSYALITPKPGWVEADPYDWLKALDDAMQDLRPVLEEVEILGMGITGQMHTLVLVGRDGKPLTNAIIWADTRAAIEVAVIRRLGPLLLGSLGNPVASGMTVVSLLWIKNNQPALLKNSAIFLMPKDWIRYQLTGEFATDMTDASGTLLFDIFANKWHEDLAKVLDIPLSIFPSLHESLEICGVLSNTFAARWGIRSGIPVACGCGDTPSAALGSGIAQGDILIGFGTGAQIISLTSGPVVHPENKCNTFRAATPYTWYTMAAIQNAGLAIEWAQSILGLSWADIAQAIAEIQPGSNGVVCVPYLSGERTPVLNEKATALWHGMRIGTTKLELIRACIEGVMFSIRSGFETLLEAGIRDGPIFVSGGVAANPLLAQLLADVLNRKMFTLDISDASVLGAAMTAMCACGLVSHEDLPEFPRKKTNKSFEPQADNLYDNFYLKYCKLRDLLLEITD